MDTVFLYKLYRAVVETGSFKRAAEQLDVPPSRATRGIQQLEEQLGVQLLIRSTRVLKTTEAGEQFYQQLTPILENLDGLHSSVRDREQNPRGTLRISSAPTFARALLIPALKEFCADFPEVDIELNLSDTNLALSQHPVDIAFRIGALQEERWIAHPLIEQRLVLCASADYILGLEAPVTLETLKTLNIIMYPELAFVRDYARQLGIAGQIRSSLTINDIEGLHRAALEGIGATWVPTYLIEEDLRHGRLVELLPELPAMRRTIHMLYPAIRPLPARIRVFVDFMKRQFDTAIDDG